MLRFRANFCKNNYRSSYKDDLKCFICKEDGTLDCEEHYLRCDYLLQSQEVSADLPHIKYSDIHGSLEQQICFVKLWSKIESLKNNVEENS